MSKFEWLITVFKIKDCSCENINSVENKTIIDTWHTTISDNNKTLQIAWHKYIICSVANYF